MPHRSSIFFSREGLRPGWGVLLFVMLMSVLMFSRGIFLQSQQIAMSLRPLPGVVLTPVIVIVLCCTAICAAGSVALLLGLRTRFGVVKVSATFCLMILWLSLLVTVISNSAHTRPTAAQMAAQRHALAESTTGREPLDGFNFEVAQLTAILATTWLLSRVEGRPFGIYGLGPGPGKPWRQFSHGVALGFIAISILVGVLWSGHWLDFHRSPSAYGPDVAVKALLWGLLFFIVGVGEENVFRGYLQFTLTRAFGRNGRGFVLAATLLSILFALTHLGNNGESPVGICQVFLSGLLFCLSLWYTGNLWWAIGYHAAWDWAQSFLFGTPDSGIVSSGRLLVGVPHGSVLLSGGATGPEGSIISLAMNLLVAIYLFMTMRPAALGSWSTSRGTSDAATGDPEQQSSTASV